MSEDGNVITTNNETIDERVYNNVEANHQDAETTDNIVSVDEKNNNERITAVLENENGYDDLSSTSSSQLSTTPAMTSSDIVKPPPALQSLKVAGMPLSLSFDHYPTDIVISRVAIKPDIFVVRNLLSSSNQRQTLMDSTINKFENAATRSGQTQHRTKSKVAWISTTTDDDTTT